MPAGLSFYYKSTGCGWCSFLLLDDTGINVGSIRKSTSVFKKNIEKVRKKSRKSIYISVVK